MTASGLASSKWGPVLGLAALLISAIGWAQSAQERPSAQWPTTAWPASSAEAQGMSSVDLADALEFARSNGINIHSLTVVRNGYLVLDAYFYPFEPGMRHDLASATKSVVAILVGIATADGYLNGVDQTIVSALPQELSRGLDDDALMVRLGDLLSMRSGFGCGRGRGEPELNEMRSAENWVEFALRLPIVSQPGTHFAYCSPNFHLLSAAIQSSTQMTSLDYARHKLFGALGIYDVSWPADPAGFNHGWGDLQLRPRDMAKLGLLMLRRGLWRDRQVVPADWVDDSVTTRVPVNGDQDYGLGWWLSRDAPSLFEASGRGGQRITVVPELNLVVVMTGGGFEPGDIGDFILRAIRSDTPLSEDVVSQRRLADSLRRIAEPPARIPVSGAATANNVSGRVYDLEENSLGVRSLSIDFVNSAIARLNLMLNSGEELTQDLGLDGQYRLTVLDDGATSAGRGEWLDDGRLRIDFNRLSLINRYLLDIESDERNIEIDAFEPTELGRVALRGAWRQ